MQTNTKSLSTILLVVGALFFSGCGPKAFVKGQYDKDIERDNLLNDQWSETDMQKAVKDLVGSVMSHPTIANSKNPPLVMITRLQNKTSEHIDTQNIMDMVRVEMMRTGKVSFVDKEAREDMDEEYGYQSSGRVTKETQKVARQLGAQFILNGRLDSIVQEVGKDKTIYYKLTLNLTDLEKGVIRWSDYKQIRKLYKKKSVGL